MGIPLPFFTLPLTCSKQKSFHLMENKNSIILHPVTSEEIHKLIKSLKSSMASGIDGIPDYIIKQCALLLVTPLLDICNASLITEFA